MSCIEIGHDWLEECGNRKVQYIISAGTHKVEIHEYEMIRCTAKIGKIYIYVISKFANCEKNYLATTLKYLAKLWSQIDVWKRKMVKT